MIVQQGLHEVVTVNKGLVRGCDSPQGSICGGGRPQSPLLVVNILFDCVSSTGFLSGRCCELEQLCTVCVCLFVFINSFSTNLQRVYGNGAKKFKM